MMLDSTVVCRRALGCEWGGGITALGKLELLSPAAGMLSFCAAAIAVPLNQRVASLDQAVALKQIGREVGFEDSATQPITVHGQPIFRFGKNHENATRLWLPTGVYKTLLTWEATGGKTLSLIGKTFHPRHSNSSRGVKKTDQVLIARLLHLVAALTPTPHPLTPGLRAHSAVV